MSKKKKNKKRKLNKKRFLIFLIIIFILSVFIYKILNTTITNIYISGNNYLTDQEIIDISKLTNYPISIKNSSNKIKSRLEKNDYVISANIKKNFLLNKIYINIIENYPLFYYKEQGMTIMYDGTPIKKEIGSIVLINEVEQKVYKKFIKVIKTLDPKILERISEIEYVNDKKDPERFLLLMNDGNYVYINIKNFLTLNKYLDIIKTFGDKKGILNLDSGMNFKTFE